MENDPCPQLTKAIGLPKEEIVSRLSDLLDESRVFTSQHAEPSAKFFSEDGDLGDLLETHRAFAIEIELVLPRGDRRTLAGLSLELADKDRPTSSSEVNTPLQEFNLLQPPSKKVRFRSPESSYYDFSPLQNDSGVVLLDIPALEENDTRNLFTQLASAAEGYEGSPGDGDAFPDLDAVHFCCDLEMPAPGVGSGPRSNSPGSRHSQRSDESINECGPRATETFPIGATREPPANLLRRVFGNSNQAADASATGCHVPLGTTDSVADNSHEFHPTTDSVDHLPKPAYLESLSTGQSLAHFMAFCGKTLLPDAAPQSSHAALPGTDLAKSDQEIEHSSAIRGTPAELLDRRTLRLPEDYEPPSTLHRYMASIDLIQRRALVRALRAYCSVELVERETLGAGITEDVHLILDCDTAVFFVALEALPACGTALIGTLTTLSWRYANLLVVLECYPSVWDVRYDATDDRPVASAWSEPVVRAVHRLRRDVQIAQGIQNMRARTEVAYGFAESVEEAAAFARVFGDVAETRDGVLAAAWGEREWLTHEERDVSITRIVPSALP